MRRARIKVQATVPVRRKALQSTTPAGTDSSTPPSTSNSVSDVEKTIPEKKKFEKVENAPENKTETEKSTESSVHIQKEPVISSPAPTLSSKNETQNIVHENEHKEESHAVFFEEEVTKKANDSRRNKDPDFSVINKETADSVANKDNDSFVKNKEADVFLTNKERDNVVTNKELNNIEANKETSVESEVKNAEINKQVDFEGSKEGDNLSSKKQAEKEVPGSSSSHVEANPTKHVQNRSCFMRPVPRLDNGGRVRKNSIQGSGASASESEDDSRKSSVPPRVRNDSVCSVQSNKDGSSNPHCVSKLKIGQQKRRLTVSESARKLAEARREFMLKHENKSPDRSTLTMYDLIYYNPTSNPMVWTDNPNPPSRKISVHSAVPEEVKEKEEEEAEDEPSAMPVPRVKVGPNGELILDQKSLIIERTEKEKNRSGPIVYVDNNGGGFYKRRKKSKDWSKWDTLRFYRALSNIGTDFLLMQSFFPKRTREELKLKFKKEERINKELVEKALKSQVFDMKVLKEDMAMFEENERKEIETTKPKVKVVKKQLKPKRSSKCRFVIGSIEEIENSCEEDEDDDLSCGESKVEKSKRVQKRKRKGPTSSEVVEEEEDASTTGTEETEIYNVKPTRSGRLPKRRKLQAPKVYDEDTSDSEEEEPAAQETQSVASSEKEAQVEPLPQDLIASLIPNAKDIEPGSLVILARESPGEPGKTVVQVYMINKDYDANDPNSEQNMTPVNLSPELLATVNSKISETTPIRVKAGILNSKQ